MCVCVCVGGWVGGWVCVCVCDYIPSPSSLLRIDSAASSFLLRFLPDISQFSKLVAGKNVRSRDKAMDCPRVRENHLAGSWGSLVDFLGFLVDSSRLAALSAPCTPASHQPMWHQPCLGGSSRLTECGKSLVLDTRTSVREQTR